MKIKMKITVAAILLSSSLNVNAFCALPSIGSSGVERQLHSQCQQMERQTQLMQQQQMQQQYQIHKQQLQRQLGNDQPPSLFRKRDLWSR